MSPLAFWPPRTTFARSLSLSLARRGVASASSSKPVASSEPSKNAPPASPSSCPAGTVLTGLNYLKGEPPVLAKPDDEYPAWLWELTKPKSGVVVDDGPGGLAEKRRLRLAHRQMLKDSNLFKAK